MTPRRKASVYLNVYDLIEHNDWTYWCGVGIFHSGVEVYGVEYAFGGHEYDAPGIFATTPREAPGTVTWRESVLIGETDLDPAGVYAVVAALGGKYRGNAYHLLQMNCNNFSEDLAFALTGQRMPAWVNRLANVALALHCLLPPGWVPPLKPPTAEASSDADAEAAPLALLAVPEATAEEERTRLLSGGRLDDAPSDPSVIRLDLPIPTLAAAR